MKTPLPCPHCGAKAELRFYQYDHRRKFYACSDRSCSHTYTNPDDALAAWNRRVKQLSEPAYVPLMCKIETND